MTTKSHKTNPADKVEQWPIEKLVPYAKNSRTHSEEQVAQIAASIREWGFTTAVLVDESGSIIAGHGRVMAARKLGMESLPVMVAAGWTDAQKRAYVIADNKLALNAGWDNELLALELGELGDAGFDLELTGFTDEEIKALMPVELDQVKNEGESEEIPSLPAKAITVPGDVWILGNHRLMCGDSTSTDAVDKLMEGKMADMIFTDPPYALFGNSTGIGGVADDKMVRPFFRDILTECKTRVKRYGHVYVCCDWHSAFVIESISREVELTAKNLIVWDKGSGGVGTMYQHCYEFVWFFGNTPKQTTTTKTGSGERIVQGVPNIWRFPRVNASEREHNAAKPVDMICVPLEASSDKGSVVLDLFGGSGSTMIACEKTGRIARMMEMEPKYCDVIIKRWQEFTGKIAVHAETGQPFAEVKDGSKEAKN